MPDRGLRRRSYKPKTLKSRDERNGESYRSHRPQHVNRQGEGPPPSPPPPPPRARPPPVPPPTPPAPSQPPVPISVPSAPSPRAGPPPSLPPVPPSALKPPPGVSINELAPGDETSDDEGSGEDDSDDEDGGSTEDPFAPATKAASETQLSIFLPADTSNPFAAPLTTDVVSSSTRGVVISSASTEPQISTTNDRYSSSTIIETAYTSIQTMPPTALAPSDLSATSTTVPASTSIQRMPPTTLAPSGLSTTSTTVPASPVWTSTASGVAVPEASNHPIAKAAVVVPSLFGSVAAVAALYLLFRYCTPIRARWAIFRARRGQRLPEEEDAVTQTATSQMAQSYATRPPETSLEPSSGPSSSTPTTPTTLFTRGTAIALPVTTTRVPPPILVRNFSKNTPQNPRVSHPTLLSRRQNGDSVIVPSGDYETYASNFNVSDYATSRISDRISSRHSRHPSGLENNPPTPVARQVPLASSPEEPVPMPNIAPIGSESGTDVGFPLPPTTPSTVHFRPQTPPESVVNYSTQRLRKSITPSESISNVPDSPVTLTPSLMPPLPNRNSRWSSNSSSMHARMLAEAMNMGPNQSSFMGTAPNGQPLSRFPSMQSSSSPVRGGSKQV